MIGKTISHYRATTRLGAGGMGEVYRATDSRLGREVALKVLRDDIARDADGLARFEREARVLAGLQHSNIAVVHGFEEAEGVRALVMELVEGPTLADRIAQGPIPLEEVLPIARQVAEGLEYAHERGIIHRDLKPANVKVTPEGVVKVLDFGLAKALEVERPQRDGGDSPTLTVASTAVGVIMGTAAYMSPEQARGKGVDRRTDVWAFGCLLYELLTRRRAFAGDTVTDTLATILHSDPDWNALPEKTPPAVRRLLRRCLEKDQRRRLQAIGEARLQLEELTLAAATGRSAAFAEDAAPPASIARPRSRAALVAVAAGGVLLGALGAWLFRPAARTPVTWLALDLAPAEQLAEGRPRFHAIALSPDGRTIAFSGLRSGKTDLYLRALDRPEATVVAGTGGATSPFFSPDGRWIGFVANEAIKKVASDGGPVTTIADLGAKGRREGSDAPAGGVYGIAWGERNRIVFGRYSDGLWEVSASGGTPARLTKLEGRSDTFAHRLPRFVPGSTAILFTRCRDLTGDSDVAVLTGSGEERILVESAADGRYVPSGHLVFVREGVLHAAPFDVSRLALTGPPVPILDGVLQATGSGAPLRNSGAAQFAFSAGTLVFARGGAQPLSRSRPVWLDRQGQAQPLDVPEGYYSRPRLSPDGTRLAVTHTAEGRRDTTRVWVLDFSRGAFSALPGQGFSSAVWSADAQRLIFRSLRPPGLFWARADGAGEPELLLPGAGGVQAGSVSPDGTVLAYVDRALETDLDIWLLPLAGEKKPRPWLRTSAAETHPEISPDGRWMAYASNVSGRYEVYVQSFPGSEGARHQVSLAGGQAPMWSRGGRELFFVTSARPRRFMVADVQTSGSFRAGRPRELFGGELNQIGGPPGYDVSVDGKRLLVVREIEAPDRSVESLQVVLNGVELLAARDRQD